MPNALCLENLPRDKHNMLCREIKPLHFEKHYYMCVTMCDLEKGTTNISVLSISYETQVWKLILDPLQQADSLFSSPS